MLNTTKDFELAPAIEIFSSEYFSRQRTVRRALKRWWVDPPKRWCAWLMLNPSNAEARKEDPTTRRLNHFTQKWGYDGWIAVNLYPFVSSDPAVMWKRADWENGPDWEARDDLAANLNDIEDAARMSALRVVAFGAQPLSHDQPWLESCIERFSQPFSTAKYPTVTGYDDENLWCLGVNSAGQPLHPMARGRMRVPDDRHPIVWRR